MIYFFSFYFVAWTPSFFGARDDNPEVSGLTGVVVRNKTPGVWAALPCVVLAGQKLTKISGLDKVPSNPNQSTIL